MSEDVCDIDFSLWNERVRLVVGLTWEFTEGIREKYICVPEDVENKWFGAVTQDSMNL
jgi:hypothetical protein